ncbi:hypothetical protein O0I10_011331 [Lichtheimia ornata]|uniref:Cysteine-rich transmembrane CYSTM domain-containing protein n=2 Tax=Lichtheimia TaxID=688353 RepID=A0AAD7XU84_9FUNG|nr:uncharacterized protein O0I10_011331 [Lichtheimia ornata]KAJ8653031.1 hypothetical protein O0I10_011331 [Lichtheimia ornata]
MPAVANAYPTTQTMSLQNEQTKKEEEVEPSTSSLLRLRGGGCVKDCLATICFCCALEAICW